MRRFVIDTDAGSDDAVALVMALMCPDILVEAVTVVCGNVPLEQAVQNALYVSELCGGDRPVFAGAAAPLERDLSTAQRVHGADGLGDVGLPLHGRQASPGHAVEALLGLANRHAGELTLVTLGPLTNIALALRKDPDFARRVSRCVVMGGTGSGPGNVTPVAEFDFWVDPEAAQEVFESGMQLEMVGWDVSIAAALFDEAEALQLRESGGPLAEFCVDIQGALNKFQQIEMGLEGFDLPDALAMAIALEPAVATRSSRLHVAIATEDELTRGQSVVDRYRVTGRAANASVVDVASRPAFLSVLNRALQRGET